MAGIKHIFFLFLLLGFNILAQDHNNHHLSMKPKDSLCLKDCLVKAHWEAHTRTFAMTTMNEGPLKDDYAFASGAGIGVLTKPLFGFQAGVSGFFMYNLYSSRLSDKDPYTNQYNRYEVGMFDLENLDNKNDLDRLEELYLKYSFSKSSITAGKMNLSTPFFNPQDGRMRPTLEEGIWLSIKESKKIGFNGGWIWDVSPRSTVRWFRLSESMGVYPVGVNNDGTKSKYQGHIQGSSGMALANVYYNPRPNLRISVWESLLENVMNTAVLEINHDNVKNNYTLYQGLMYLHQDAINNGGNVDQDLTYINKGASSNVLSGQVGIKYKKFNTSLNYTHITGDGRYLMPREWGKEFFYTVLPRERNEGFGDLHAWMAKTTYTSKNKKLNATLAYGYYKLPDVKNYRLNKYGLPSYHHINFESVYKFDKFFKGMELHTVFAYKINAGDTYNNPKYVYNKVNMLNANVILDFKI